jgi:hypothetical protein
MNTETKYGLMTYKNTGNIGDEIQSLAARQFLPSVDYTIDREELGSFYSKNQQQVFVILNGWYCHHPENWPPSPYISPLMVAIHISSQASVFSGLSPVEAMLSEPAAEYLRAVGPIGARDLQTRQLLEEAGIECYFSACLTLTLERPNVVRDDGLIVLCDVPDPAYEKIKASTSKRIERVSHVGFMDNRVSARFKRAEELIELYARASCVVTTRLHCALPCTAIRTPVYLIDSAADQERFSGLNELVRHGPIRKYLEGKVDFDLNDPGANPDTYQQYRSTLIAKARNFIESSKVATSKPPALSVEQRLAISQQTLARVSKAAWGRIRRSEREIQKLSELLKDAKHPG